MKIQSIETFSSEFVCFVRVTVDEGQQGWGQVAPYFANITAQVVHRQVAPHTLRRDALDVDSLVDLVVERGTNFQALTCVVRLADSTLRSGICAVN